jgi:hypothetical protein
MIWKFERKRLDQTALYGKIVKRSRLFTLIAKEYDFQFDGFKIIRNKDITLEISNDSTKYCAKIMKMENAWPRIPRVVRNLNVESWGSILSGIKSTLSIENERDECGFYIGVVEKVTKTKVQIRCFNGVGKWQGHEFVNFSSITSCNFLDRYSSIHSKYLEWS